MYTDRISLDNSNHLHIKSDNLSHKDPHYQHKWLPTDHFSTVESALKTTTLPTCMEC